jgi:hypothetical protein
MVLSLLSIKVLFITKFMCRLLPKVVTVPHGSDTTNMNNHSYIVRGKSFLEVTKAVFILIQLILDYDREMELVETTSFQNVTSRGGSRISS